MLLFFFSFFTYAIQFYRVPRPTENGEIWVFAKHYTHYMPVSLSDLRSWLGDPSIYILDCSGAGALLEHFLSPIQPEFDPTKSGNI